MTSAQALAIETARTPEAVEIETISHYLAVWFERHPGCKSEIAQFKTALAYIETICGEDDLAAQHLHLTLLKDWYRSFYSHNWSEHR